MTPKEYGILQAFPMDDWKQVVSDSQAYKQFGNAVTTTVFAAIAEEIAKSIYAAEESEEQNMEAENKNFTGMNEPEEKPTAESILAAAEAEANDIKLAEYIENKIVENKYSPEAALAAVATSGIEFSTTISVRTLYRYIDNGIFLKLTNKHLPVKGKKKKKNKKVQVQKRAAAGESIENRPDEVATRETFGHWEMDTVKGKQGVTKSCMLVLTERKTRDEIIFKLKDQKAESVVDALDRLERKWGDMFSKVFRSITVDNGVEFSDCKGMERSALTPGEKRTYLFYCHPYSSWERGTNENTNKLIRRHIPKGEDFDEKQDRDIEFIENWINTYPRGIFGFKTSEELFKEELEKITA